MEHEEDFKSKETPNEVINGLPDINEKQRNQFFQLDDFNSEDKENKEASRPALETPDNLGKTKSNMMNTHEKVKDFENEDSHKNGTVSESDHKLFRKYTNPKMHVLNDGTPMSNRKVTPHDEAHPKPEESHKAEDEIIAKEKGKCPKCHPKVIHIMNKILENNIYIIFMTIVTIYALFADDFRLLLAPKSADEVFWSLTCAALFFFAVELIMASFAQKDYFLGFYFWLDLIATVSLFTDIGWIYNELVGGGDISASNASQASSLARAGRGARVGTRAGRIVRLVRLIRIVKLYKHAHKALEKEQHDEEHEDISAEELAQIQKSAGGHDIPKESHVGQKLSDLTTRRVIVIVLIMMFSVPLLSLDTYREEPNSFEYGLQLIQAYESGQGGNGWNLAFNSYVSEFDETRNPVVSLNANDQTYDDPDIQLSEFRTLEVLVATYDNEKYVSVHDNRKNIQLSAGLGIGRTLFICLVLTVAAM